MAVWALLLTVLTAAGMAAGFIGLTVTLPLAGHATWHAYWRHQGSGANPCNSSSIPVPKGAFALGVVLFFVSRLLAFFGASREVFAS
jgi:hypothetical protein